MKQSKGLRAKRLRIATNEAVSFHACRAARGVAPCRVTRALALDCGGRSVRLAGLRVFRSVVSNEPRLCYYLGRSRLRRTAWRLFRRRLRPRDRARPRY